MSRSWKPSSRATRSSIVRSGSAALLSRMNCSTSTSASGVALHGELDASHLDVLAQLIKVEDLLHVERAAIEPRIGREGQEAVRRQPVQRLAERRPADAELPGDGNLVDPLAGPEGEGDREPFQLVIDALHRAHGALGRLLTPLRLNRLVGHRPVAPNAVYSPVDFG
jgi:hypothetical protein